MERQDYTEQLLEASDYSTIVREVPIFKPSTKRRIGFFTGDEQHVISLEKGIELTRNYRKSTGKNAEAGTYFGREIFEKILGQNTCVGIRIYYARQTNGRPTLVLTGAQTNGDDLFQGTLAQEARFSSPVPFVPNQLNSDSVKKNVTVNRQTKVFSGKENHYVTLAEAAELTKNHRESMKEGDAKGAFFGSGIYRKILAQSNCVGIRIYNAMHNDGSPTFVLVGVDEFGFDLLGGILGQMAMLCPPWCYVFGPLNK
ncbi:MAG TPA: hypothetical protein VI758_08820 [Bacteroidota bacterium]